MYTGLCRIRPKCLNVYIALYRKAKKGKVNRESLTLDTNQP